MLCIRERCPWSGLAERRERKREREREGRGEREGGGDKIKKVHKMKYVCTLS